MNRKFLWGVVAGAGVLAIGFYVVTVLQATQRRATPAPATQAQAAAPTDSGALALGKRFPDFTLIDLDGKEVNMQSLAGKPAIIWFTAGWCVPCQIGAKVVASLDDELGGDAFDVVVVFIDPREKKSSVRSWQSRFANNDWMVGFDNPSQPLADIVSLKFLDSKYLIDGQGVLRNTDFRIANDKYLATVRSIVEAN